MPEDHTVLSGTAIQEVERIAQEAAPRAVTIGGKEYATKLVVDPRTAEPEPRSLDLHTLQSFVDFVNSDIDEMYRDPRGIFVHVGDEETVALFTGIFGEFNQRVRLAQATPILPQIHLGQFLDPETFNIHLLSAFEATEDREKIFEITGNLADQAVKIVEDDGVSQEVTLRTGVVRSSRGSVPLTVRLTPFRTFPEVAQVESPFILRVRGGGDNQPPTCALFECDGGRWRIEAIKRVRDWLSSMLPHVEIFA